MSDHPFEPLMTNLLNDTFPSSGDGISNAERSYFICRVFGVTNIDLTDRMNYEHALEHDDPDVVLASLHLAKLQFQFFHTCRILELIDPHIAELNGAWAHLMIAKLSWHLKHLRDEKPTPPYGFVN